MRGQLIAQRIWQPIYKWLVTKVILPAPIHAVRFEKIQTIRHKDHCPAARPKHPCDLARALVVILHMLQHIVTKHNVKCVVCKGQSLTHRAEQPRDAILRTLLHSINLNIKTEYML